MPLRLFLLVVLIATGVTPSHGASPFEAFVRSLLIPGWAQHANGQSHTALRFAVAEGLLWSGYFGLSAVSSIREDNYRTFATSHAGATPEGKGGVYFDDLGFYMSQQQHDLFALVDDGAEAQLYGAGDGNTWEWDRDASRKRFRRMRNAAESAERNALFATGLVVVNHLVSAIHAARNTEASFPTAAAIQWQVEPFRGRSLVQGMSLVRRF